MKASMYKRNQIELAISNLLEPEAGKPSSGLRTRIKRLLETDRAFGRSSRTNDVEKANFAFFRDEAPGSGFEVWFSEYEAFALVLGLQLMQHSWTQRFVVSVLRRVRPSLEKEHKRILNMDSRELFDAKAIEAARRPGSHAYATTRPAFLVIVSHYGLSADQEDRPYACSVQKDLRTSAEWLQKTIRGVGGGSSMFELTIIAHRLAQALQQTTPQSRGRPG
jgi:hypothetical protein